MCKFVSLFVLSLCLLGFSSSVFADPVEGKCDDQKGEGVTQGVYGLCVAFHSSKSDRAAIRDKYERKVRPGDPPLIEEDVCACWESIDFLTDPDLASCTINDQPGATVIRLELNEGATSYQAVLYKNLVCVSNCAYDEAVQQVGENVYQCIAEIEIAIEEMEIICN
mgnify:CR=1 FL=1